jgi:hypothetical protein
MTPHHSAAQFLNVTAATAVLGNEQSVEDEPVGRRRSKRVQRPSVQFSNPEWRGYKLVRARGVYNQ